MTASRDNLYVVPDLPDDVLVSFGDFLPAFGAGSVEFPTVEVGK